MSKAPGLASVLAAMVLLGVAFLENTTGAVLAQSAATPTPPPAGGSAAQGDSGASSGGGASTLPIESTIFAYQGLEADATVIGDAINTELLAIGPKGKSASIVIGTPTDIAALVQLRVILQQATFLQDRIGEVDAYTHLPNKLCNYPLRNASQPQTGRNQYSGQSFLSTPSDLSTLISTITSLSAVNTTLTAASGALSDNSLVTLVANYLTNAQVMSPSMYTPNALSSGQGSGWPNLNGTYVGEALTALGDSRKHLNGDVILAQCKDASVLTATSVVNASLDTFNWTLFTGQTPPPALAPAKPASSTPTKRSNPKAPTPANPIIFMNQAPGVPAAPTTMLQQILPADFLLHQILSEPNPNAYFLLVHALESGGQQLTKQNGLFGSRVYVSGGSVAAFALFAPTGNLICSGIAYGYRGFINTNNVADAIDDTSAAPKRAGTKQLTCRPFSTPPSGGSPPNPNGRL